MMIITLLSTLASAQELPALDADAWHSALDTAHTFATEDAAVTEGTSATAVAHWAHRLPTSLVDPTRIDNVLSIDLGATWARGPVRLGLTAPVHVQPGRIPPRMGDLGVDLKLATPDLPVAALARVAVPAGAWHAALGHRYVASELGVAATHELGSASLLANLGYRWIRGAHDAADTADDELWARLGAAYAVSAPLTVSAELLASVPVWGHRGAPLEAVVGLHHTSERGDVHRVALSAGTGGVGSPDVRILIGTTVR